MLLLLLDFVKRQRRGTDLGTGKEQEKQAMQRWGSWSPRCCFALYPQLFAHLLYACHSLEVVEMGQTNLELLSAGYCEDSPVVVDH